MNLTALNSASTTRDNAVLAGALALQMVVLAWDIATPLGRTEWVFHLLPVTLLLLQPRPWAPIALVRTGWASLWIGFDLSPNALGVNTDMAIVNRAMGGFSMAAMAAVMTLALRQRRDTRRMMWVQQGKATLSQRVAGEGSPDVVGARIVQALCDVTGATLGALYRVDGPQLILCGHCAVDPADLPAELPVRAGLLGQALADAQVQVLSPAPPGHLLLRSALGHSDPAHLVILPVRAEGGVLGVVELGFVGRGIDASLVADLCSRSVELLGLGLRAAVYRLERQALLEESQRQAEELQVQQEALRVNNEELEEQSRLLRESQAALEAEHNALTHTNAQLEVQTQSLEQQKAALQRAQIDLQQQTDALAAASRYKSEFLANMSHELRTPLNSALILSRLLIDNRDRTLTAEQTQYAQAIHDANNDLLALINDILDLSKVEAGHADLRAEPVRLSEAVARLRATLEPLARDKQLDLSFHLAPDAPTILVTDGLRLQQVLKNLLANALKFTRQGGVSMHVARSDEGRVRIDVVDTGVGIPADKHQVIFEAFRQADGSTSRQFGGTGLGLSISRELVQRMGGHITLCSAPGQGSTFSVFLPLVMPEDGAGTPPALPKAAGAAPAALAAVDLAPGPEARLPSERPPAAGTSPAPVEPAPSGRHVLMAVEDDARFAAVLKSLIGEMGFDCIVATTGEQALAIARQRPLSGILLDVGLPDQSGLAVLERLKQDPVTRHVPVHVVSSMERSHAALEMGAVGHAVKPVRREQLVEAIGLLEQKLQQPVRRVLVVEDDPALRDSLKSLLSAPQVEILTAGTVAEALVKLASTTFDCMVTDLSLPDGSGDDLIDRMAASQAQAFPPVIVYTGRALSRDEEHRLRRHSRSIIVKGARSPERLLDEVTLFLHSVEAQLPEDRRRMLSLARERDAVLEGRCILLAEDDVRNVFALTSVFEQHGVRLVLARNGREALAALSRDLDIDLVLMDIMMPEMDGLEALRRIRAQPAYAALPIIALTAKAMADDRQQCLAAGASDYLAKPIDVQRLLSLCRVWMPK